MIDRRKTLAAVALLAALILGFVFASGTGWFSSPPAAPVPEHAGVLPPPDLGEPAKEKPGAAGTEATSEPPAGTILVRVVDSDGRPMPGTEVRFRTGDYAVLTDERGEVRVALPNRTERTLMLEPPGWRYLFVDFAEGQRAIRIVIPTPHRREVRGTVVDEHGRTVAGAFAYVVRPGDLSGWTNDPREAIAQIDFLRNQVKQSSAVVLSGEDGSFTLLAEEGKDQVMMAVKAGYLAERTVLRQEATTVQLHVRQAATLRVHLTGPDGPLTGGSVGLYRGNEGDSAANVDAPASPLVVTPLAPGKWTIDGAWDISQRLELLEPVELELRAGEVRDLELRLAPPPPQPKAEVVHYRVRLVDADGQPLPREEIDRCTAPDGRQDRFHIIWGDHPGNRRGAGAAEDGTLSFRVPTGVAPSLVVHRTPGMPELKYSLPAGGGEHQVSLPVRLTDMVYTLRGQVLDPDGKPLLAAYVRLQEDVSGRRISTSTDVWGRFRFDRLLPAPWTVTAHDREFIASSMRLDRAPKTEVVLKLRSVPAPEPTGRLVVRLLADQADFPNARIIVLPTGRSLGAGPTGEACRELPPDRYTVMVACPIEGGLILDARAAVVVEGETTTVELCGNGLAECRLHAMGMEEPYRLWISAVDADGKLVSRAWLTVTDEPIRLRFPESASGLRLQRSRGFETIELDAPRGDITIKWKKLAPK